MTELKDKKACFPEYAGLGKDPISFCVHLKPLICYQFYLQFKYGVKVWHIKCMYVCMYLVGSDSSVGIATRYGLDGPGIESR